MNLVEASYQLAAEFLQGECGDGDAVILIHNKGIFEALITFIDKTEKEREFPRQKEVLNEKTVMYSLGEESLCVTMSKEEFDRVPFWMPFRLEIGTRPR